MARTDIHRPSALKVEDYQFIKFDYLPDEGDVLGAAMFLADERARFMAHMKRTGARYATNHSAGSCYVCGAHALYTATFYHQPTNTYICTGLDCGENLDAGDASAFKRKVRLGFEAVAGKRKAKAVLEKAGLGAAWTLYEADIKKSADYRAACAAWREANPEPECRSSNGGYGIEEAGAPKYVEWGKDERTILDMVAKLSKYGDISQKALNYLGVLLKKISPEAAAKLAAEKAAELATAKPVPEGRMLVKGEVLTTRVDDGFYGRTVKALLKVESGDGWFKLWGTLPAALVGSVERGSVVEFTAAVKRSDKDEFFGFWSRPAKAKVFKKELV